MEYGQYGRDRANYGPPRQDEFKPALCVSSERQRFKSQIYPLPSTDCEMKYELIGDPFLHACEVYDVPSKVHGLRVVRMMNEVMDDYGI